MKFIKKFSVFFVLCDIAGAISAVFFGFLLKSGVSLHDSAETALGIFVIVLAIELLLVRRKS